MINRRTLLSGVAASAAVVCTPVQAALRNYTYNELQDFWRLLKEQQCSTTDELRALIQDRFGTLPIKFFGLNPRTNQTTGVEIVSLFPYSDKVPSSREEASRLSEDGAMIEYKIYAGGEHLMLSQRHGYQAVTLYPRN